MTQGGGISIWFFVGAVLVVYGALIAASGLYQLWVPPLPPVVLEKLHAGIWWGALLFLAGLFYAIHFRPGKRA